MILRLLNLKTIMENVDRCIRLFTTQYLSYYFMHGNFYYVIHPPIYPCIPLSRDSFFSINHQILRTNLEPRIHIRTGAIAGRSTGPNGSITWSAQRGVFASYFFCGDVRTLLKFCTNAHELDEASPAIRRCVEITKRLVHVP
jgi:hypothetical protein